jgi:hypothetical protein
MLSRAWPERVAFSTVHYLAITYDLAVTCDEDVLARRIRARKPPRRTDDANVKEHVEFNGWLRANAPTSVPHVTLVDTTHSTIAETSASVAAWIRSTSHDIWFALLSSAEARVHNLQNATVVVARPLRARH